MQIVILTEKLSCGNFFTKKIAAAFLFARQKERNYQNETQKTTMFVAFDGYGYLDGNSIPCGGK